MNSGITVLEHTYEMFFVGILLILGVLLFVCLLRACLGPTVADRLVAVNMMSTMVIVIIAILAILLDESYLVDICIIYATLSFLAVVLLSKVIIGIHKQQETKDAPVSVTESEPKTVQTSVMDIGAKETER